MACLFWANPRPRTSLIGASCIYVPPQMLFRELPPPATTIMDLGLPLRKQDICNRMRRLRREVGRELVLSLRVHWPPHRLVRFLRRQHDPAHIIKERLLSFSRPSQTWSDIKIASTRCRWRTTPLLNCCQSNQTSALSTRFRWKMT